MRILQLVANLDYGGLERLAIGLARQQRAAGHEAAICCLTHEGALADEARESGIEVAALDKKPGFSPLTLLKLARILRRGRIDVLHTHNAVVHHYGAAAARLAGVPVVVNTRHGFGGRQWDSRRERLSRSVMRWTGAVVFVSDDLRREFVSFGGVPEHKARVITNGIDFDRFAAMRARPGSCRSRFRIGTVGRMVPVKDHATLVSAFAEVAAAVPNAELHIVGDGPEKPRVASLVAAYGLWDRVVLHGFSNATAQFLSSLDVFALSSLSEGLPLAVLEAMAAGLPIVSTRLEGVEAVAPEGEFGFYAEPGDASGLAKAMIALAREPRIGAIGEAAHRAARRYGMEGAWRQYEAVFRGLLEGESAGAAPAGAAPATTAKCA